MSAKVEYYTMRVYQPMLYEWEGMFSDLMYLAERYLEESGLDLSYDPIQLGRYIENVCQSQDHVVIVLRAGGVTVGFAVVGYENYWTVEPLASVMLYYIAEPFRSTQQARRLLSACESEARSYGASYMFANTIAAISNRATEAFGLLCQRNGFTAGSMNYTKEL